MNRLKSSEGFAMTTSKYKALECEISRGGFSDERVFVLMGSVKHQGIASRRHMWTRNGQPIDDGEPPLGNIVSGLIAARIIEIHGQHALVSIPDGEVLDIPIGELFDRPIKAVSNVPVGS